MKPNKQKQRKELLDEINNNITLIKAPAPSQDTEKIKVDVSNKKAVQNEAMEE